MREADVQLVQADRCGSSSGGSVQPNQRLPARVRQYLDVAPGDAAYSRPEGLHYRLLRGESCRELADSSSTIGDLERGIDALQEPARVALDNASNPRNLDHIDADGMLCHAFFPARC